MKLVKKHGLPFCDKTCTCCKIIYCHLIYIVAPTNSVSGLTLEETGGKSVKASWEEARLSLPEGPIARYQLEYRNGPDSLSNPAHVTPEQTFLTFYGIENADNFQVLSLILCLHILS